MSHHFVAALTGIAVACAVLAAPPAAAGPKEASALAAKKAAIIARMHSKASKALVNYAQDKAFIDYFTASDSERQSAKAKIDQLSLVVQSRFAVEEMCLIDEHGHEISRIVGNKVAPESDLSTEEASAPFFAPTFAKDPKRVHISSLYVSPDAAKWVVAYVTPVVGGDGAKEAILHYEHGLDSFQEVIAKGTPAGARVMVADKGGLIVADSAADIAVTQKGESEAPADYFAPLPAPLAAAITLGGTGKGMVEMNGKHHGLAYRAVEDWTVIAIDPAAH